MKKLLVLFLTITFLYCHNNNELSEQKKSYSFEDSSKIYIKKIDSLQKIIKKLSIKDSLLVDTLSQKINILKEKLFFSPIKKSGIYLKILSIEKNGKNLTIQLYIKNLSKKQLLLNHENFLLITNIKSIIKPINFQNIKLKPKDYKKIIITFNVENEVIESFNFIIPEKNIMLKKRYIKYYEQNI